MFHNSSFTSDVAGTDSNIIIYNVRVTTANRTLTSYTEAYNTDNSVFPKYT